MSSPFLASDLTSWYNRINSVRSRPGIALGKISVPNVQNTVAKASTINNLKTQITALKSNSYLSLANYTSVDNLTINSDTRILQTQKNAFESTITSLEGICAKTSTTGNNVSSYGNVCSRDSNQSTSNSATCSKNSDSDCSASASYSINRSNCATCPVGDGFSGNCYDSSHCTIYTNRSNNNASASYANYSNTTGDNHGTYRGDYCTNCSDQKTTNTVTGNSYTG